MTCCLDAQALLQPGVVISDVTQQPNHFESGRLEQFKALSTYWDVFCRGGGLWTATVLDSGLPRVSHHHRYPTIPLLFCQSKARHGGFSKMKNKQPQKSVLESHLFIQQLFVCFTLIRCLAQFAAVWGDLLEWSRRWGGGSTGLSPHALRALERRESFTTFSARCVSSTPAFT